MGNRGKTIEGIISILRDLMGIDASDGVAIAIVFNAKIWTCGDLIIFIDRTVDGISKRIECILLLPFSDQLVKGIMRIGLITKQGTLCLCNETGQTIGDTLI